MLSTSRKDQEVCLHHGKRKMIHCPVTTESLSRQTNWPTPLYIWKGSSCNRNLDYLNHSQTMQVCCLGSSEVFPSNYVFLQNLGVLMCECGHGWLIDPGIQTWDPAPLELWPEEGIRCVGFLWLTSLSKSYQSATLSLYSVFECKPPFSRGFSCGMWGSWENITILWDG